jgi:hypothetical protein
LTKSKEDLSVIHIKLSHVLIELSCEDNINFSIISKSMKQTYKYEDVLSRDSKLSFKVSNLEDELEEITLLVFRPNATPVEHKSPRLLESSGIIFIIFFYSLYIRYILKLKSVLITLYNLKYLCFS